MKTCAGYIWARASGFPDDVAARPNVAGASSTRLGGSGYRQSRGGCNPSYKLRLIGSDSPAWPAARAPARATPDSPCHTKGVPPARRGRFASARGRSPPVPPAAIRQIWYHPPHFMLFVSALYQSAGSDRQDITLNRMERRSLASGVPSDRLPEASIRATRPSECVDMARRSVAKCGARMRRPASPQRRRAARERARDEGKGGRNGQTQRQAARTCP